MDSIFEITEKLIPSLTKALKHPQGVSGLSTGFEVLNRLTGGWQNGELIVVAAPEYMGKTALALSMLKNTMCDSEFETFWFSTGLSNLQLTKMLIYKCMSLDMHKLISGEVDIIKLNSLIEKFKFSGIYFDDSPYLTIDDIDTKLSERFKSFPVELVIIDDINHLNYSEKNYNDFNDKFYQLKTLARKYEIPIIVLMDIEISAADNADYSDCLSAYYQQHTKNSGIDMLINLFRPEYFRITEFEDGNSSLGYADLIISGRFLDKGMVRLKYKNHIFVSNHENEKVS